MERVDELKLQRERAALPDTMRAVRFHSYSKDPSKVLQIDQVPVPRPKDDEVLIRVGASSINPIDWKVITGYFNLPLPSISGGDVSGEVVAAGKDVTRVRVGDRVWSKLGVSGAFAEFACASEKLVALAPSNLSVVEAATVPLAGLTALHSLRKANFQKGQTLLILGASGGVGHFALQLARILGASKVWATAGPTGGAVVRSLGAEHIDYTKQKWGDVLAGQRLDAVMQFAVSPDDLAQAARVLKEGGQFVSTVAPASKEDLDKAGAKYHHQVFVSTPSGADLDTLRAYFEAGQMKVEVEKVWDAGRGLSAPLEEAVLPMFAASQSGHIKGKHALLIGASQRG